MAKFIGRRWSKSVKTDFKRLMRKRVVNPMMTGETAYEQIAQRLQRSRNPDLNAKLRKLQNRFITKDYHTAQTYRDIMNKDPSKLTRGKMLQNLSRQWFENSRMLAQKKGNTMKLSRQRGDIANLLVDMNSRRKLSESFVEEVNWESGLLTRYYKLTDNAWPYKTGREVVDVIDSLIFLKSNGMGGERASSFTKKTREEIRALKRLRERFEKD